MAALAVATLTVITLADVSGESSSGKRGSGKRSGATLAMGATSAAEARRMINAAAQRRGGGRSPEMEAA